MLIEVRGDLSVGVWALGLTMVALVDGGGDLG